MVFHNFANPDVTIILKKPSYLTLLMESVERLSNCSWCTLSQ